VAPVEGAGVPQADDQDDEAFEALLVYLRDQRGADFTGYKRPSLRRLVGRRMSAVGAADPAAYVDVLQVQPEELRALLDTLLINVTALFRDPAAWEELAKTWLPEVLAALGPDEPIRVWSAACASGEEAYTLAIVLHELLGDDDYKRRVKVYATDIDDDALASARAGRFTDATMEGLSPERRLAYFEQDGTAWRFRSDLRPSLIFGHHDLLQDAPISRVALLCCRNALMYFTPETQSRVLQRFAFALHDAGIMMLGKAEMLLTQSQVFEPLSLQQRIFRARAGGSSARLASLAVGGQTRGGRLRRVTEAAFEAAPAPQVVLDAEGRVALLKEAAGRDLLLSQADLGRPFAELSLSLTPQELRGSVAAVQASGDPVQLTDLRWPQADGVRWRDVTIAPLLDGGSVLGVHLVFEDTTAVHELRQELEQSHHDLTTAYEEIQNSSEELETTNEELQSAIEELETTNEELQSTNEELETMNEELQSTNEELQTLNDELRDRTLQVDDANGFLQSILEGLEQAVVVVDSGYRVQLWNTGAERLSGLRSFEAEGLHFLDLELGLPVEEVQHLLRAVVVQGEARGVLEVDVTNRFGQPHRRVVTVSALRHHQGDVRGAVVSLADVATGAAPA
jgi:two-component system CheB/CheR fusion protein